MAFVYISFLHVKVVHATSRPWKGCKSGRKCGEVDENMSEHGTSKAVQWASCSVQYGLEYNFPSVIDHDNCSVNVLYKLIS